jgi:hypothetical protein
VERVFSRIDDGVAASGGAVAWRRLVVCVLPVGLPVEEQALWPELAGKGRWVPLEQPFGKLALGLAKALASRELPAELDAEEGLWAIECGTALSELVEGAGGTALSWTALEAMRREFLKHLNSIHRDLKSADQATEELRRLDLRRLISPALNKRTRVREFLRAVLLSGNGSLVFNNSFVQWGSSEALRRAQPQVLWAGFGVRQKLKPFSSVVLFEDQRTSNPTPDQDDPAGSAVDALLLSRYVHLTAEGLPAYRDRTLTLFAVEDLGRMLVIGPAGRFAAPGPVDAAQLKAEILEWLAVQG